MTATTQEPDLDLQVEAQGGALKQVLNRQGTLDGKIEALRAEGLQLCGKSR